MLEWIKNKLLKIKSEPLTSSDSDSTEATKETQTVEVNQNDFDVNNFFYRKDLVFLKKIF